MKLTPLISIFLSLVACTTKQESISNARYTFARWTFSQPLAKAKPRGGTTTGPKTDKADVHPAWQTLVNSKKTRKEKDRLAILGMVGTYKASFEFIETFRFDQSNTLDRPYQSWGTEYVFPIELKPNFISLQHIMVMYYKKDGMVKGPFVMKHWRQDWTYEAKHHFAYLGDGMFKKLREKRSAVRGSWLQSVYQVDDSPRYEARGYWRHEANHSEWTSKNSTRPLPRREYSIRKDYNILEGTHRITILPTGWIHEQDNLKLSRSKHGKKKYLSRELGKNTYESLKNFDISAGQNYWNKSAGFWKEVRKAWQKQLAKQNQFVFESKKNNQALFEKMFSYASSADGKKPADWRDFAEKTIKEHISKKTKNKSKISY